MDPGLVGQWLAPGGALVFGAEARRRARRALERSELAEA